MLFPKNPYILLGGKDGKLCEFTTLHTFILRRLGYCILFAFAMPPEKRSAPMPPKGAKGAFPLIL